MIQSLFGSFARSSTLLDFRERHELVVRGMNRGQRNGRHAVDDRRDAEGRLVRGAVRHVDQRVLPSPSQLVEVGQPEADDAGDRRLRSRIGRRKHRQPGSFRHADQNRLLGRPTRGEVGKHLVVAGFVFRTQRGLAGREALEVRPDVEADDEEPLAASTSATCGAR